MGGYRLIGSVVSAKAPSSTTTIEMTAAKIGRRMKRYLTSSVSGGGVIAALPLLGPGPGRGLDRRGGGGIGKDRRVAPDRKRGVAPGVIGHRSDRRVRPDLLDTIDDDLVTRLGARRR